MTNSTRPTCIKESTKIYAHSKEVEQQGGHNQRGIITDEGKNKDAARSTP